MTQQRIKQLPDTVAHKIAAGEVIERPASAVKELLENALDAEATRIEVEVTEAGKELIRITDNGRGIHREDLRLAFSRHATSKIATASDLFSIRTLGFRGEALASIASVALLQIQSRTKDQPGGQLLKIDGGQEVLFTPKGMAVGTIVEVRDLFYNTPARLKFLKSTSAEKRYIMQAVTATAMAHPEVSIKLNIDEKQVFFTTGNGSLQDVLGAVYSLKVVKDMRPLQWDAPWGKISGYIGLPSVARGNRTGQTFILNQRVIESYMLSKAVEQGFNQAMRQKKYPMAVVVLSMERSMVDVNVHPAKTEVRFVDEQDIFRQTARAVQQALLQSGLDLKRPAPVSPPFHETPCPSNPLHFNWQPPSERVEENFTMAGTSTQDASAIKSRSTETVSVDRPAVQSLLSGKIIGQLHQTYVLLEVEDGLWILDQHIVHERILYERYLSEEKEPTAQMVMPQVLEFSMTDFSRIGEHLEAMAELLLDVEPFGDNCYILRSVPASIQKRGDMDEEAILDLVQALETKQNPRQAAAIVMACHGAIKAGDYLDKEHIRVLLNDLAKTENPFTCPHGRPIIVRLEKDELMRRFGRK